MSPSPNVRAVGLTVWLAVLAVGSGAPSPQLKSDAVTPATWRTIEEFVKAVPALPANSRVQVQGTVTYQYSGKSIFIQDQTGALFAATDERLAADVGDLVAVTGLLNKNGYSPTLRNATCRKLGPGLLPKPVLVTAKQAQRGQYDGRLVRISGRLWSESSRDGWLRLNLIAEDSVFRADLPVEASEHLLDRVRTGSQLEIIGICSVETDSTGKPLGFRIVVPSAKNISVVGQPPWWTLELSVGVAEVVGLLVLAVMGWILALNYRVRKQTALIQERLEREVSLEQHYRETLEEKVRERTAQLEAANKELEAFSYSVSHDLKAPLRAIDGFSRILQEMNPNELSGECAQLLDGIQRNAAKMDELIRDLLALSRVGRLPLRCTSLDIATMARTVFDDLQAEAGKRQIELTIGSLPPGCGDPVLVKQVLTNLLANAIKYTRPREVGRIEIGGQRSDGETLYLVKDNGVGFDMQYAEKLFGVFQRLHSPADFEGSGVGLAIVQRIVQRHGGRVWAESVVDQGTTLYFTLPERKTDAATETTDHTTDAPMKSTRTLSQAASA